MPNGRTLPQPGSPGRATTDETRQDALEPSSPQSDKGGASGIDPVRRDGSTFDKPSQIASAQAKQEPRRRRAEVRAGGPSRDWRAIKSSDHVPSALLATTETQTRSQQHLEKRNKASGDFGSRDVFRRSRSTVQCASRPIRCAGLLWRGSRSVSLVFSSLISVLWSLERTVARRTH